MKIGEPRQIERGGKIIKKEDCKFVISEEKGLGKKEKAIGINLFDGDKHVGGISIEELNNKELGKQYVQLRVVNIVNADYLGGNAVILLYEKAIEYAESLSKKLLFDSQLTIPAYKSFKKLENFGYKIIENPDMKFDGSYYSNPGSWTLRVERENK